MRPLPAARVMGRGVEERNNIYCCQACATATTVIPTRERGEAASGRMSRPDGTDVHLTS